MGRMEEDGEIKYVGTIPQILTKAGFSVKLMVQSGANPKQVLEKMGSNVLGHHWNPAEDILSFPFEFHHGKKTRSGFYPGELISMNNLDEVCNQPWTLSDLLSATSSQYDPTGLTSPLLISTRIFLRQMLMTGEKTNWNEVIDKDKTLQWKAILAKFLTGTSLNFPMRLSPANAKGRPALVAFSDGSNVAYCCSLYLRWGVGVEEPGPWGNELGERLSWESNLILAKCRVTPLAGITIPRSESNALLTAYKMVDVCLRSLNVKPENVYFLIDSECLVAALQSQRGKLAPYLANRRAEMGDEYVQRWEEIHPEVKVHPPLHIPGLQNVADLGTRGLAVAKDICFDSKWQKGPSFLQLSFDNWPVNSHVEAEVPEEEILKKFRVSVNAVHLVKANAGAPLPLPEGAARAEAVQSSLSLHFGVL